MYEFSRAIYRELADEIIEEEGPAAVGLTNHAKVLRACEAAIERLAYDRHYFAHPARTLFRDIRVHFPICSQHRVFEVICHHLERADAALAAQRPEMPCRATTRRGTPCQRTPVAQNGYCPSHQHLAETEEIPAVLAAA